MVDCCCHWSTCSEEQHEEQYSYVILLIIRVVTYVTLWNGLDRDNKHSNSISSFKYKLKKAKCTKAINHTRMRLGLSGLKAQRHAYKHVNSPKCDYCGARQEDPMHYFLQCNVFNTMRAILLNDVKGLYQTKNVALCNWTYEEQ